MADNEVTIKTKIDESGVDKGLKSVKGKVNNAAKDMNKGAKATNTLKTALNETGGAASSALDVASLTIWAPALSGSPRERFLRPECANHYTAVAPPNSPDSPVRPKRA